MVAEILDNPEQIIKKIIEKGMPEPELMEKIKAKQEEYGGLLTEAGAAYSIAREMGIEFEEEKQMKINELTDGLSNVNLTAKVLEVFQAREFEKEGRKGTVLNLVIGDETGKARLVIWNKPLEVQRNDLLKIRNAYTKIRENEVEVNIGIVGSISIEKHGEENLISLSELKEGMPGIDFVCRIVQKNLLKEFEKEGRKGKMVSMQVTDGKIIKRLVLWNQCADSADELNVNDLIKVKGAYVKQNKGELELHLGRGTIVKDVHADIPLMQTLIKDLQEGDKKQIKATVVGIYPPTILEICSKCGMVLKQGRCPNCRETEVSYSMIMNAELDDGSDVIGAVFYRTNAEQFLGVKAGELKENQNIFEQRKTQLLGEEKLFFGEVKNIPEYNRKEFVVRSFSDINIEDEAKKHLKGGLNG